MTHITLDSAQAKLVLQSRDQVQLWDPDGNVIGIVAPAPNFAAEDSPFTAEEIAAAKRALAAPGPWRTTQEVLERLRSKWPEQG